MYWTYEYSVHWYAKVRRATDSHADQWLGPFDEIKEPLGASDDKTDNCFFLLLG